MSDSWKYRKMKNQYGNMQTFDCSHSPAIPVCADCHKPYDAVIDVTICRDCSDPIEDDDDCPFFEEINEYGFLQTYQLDGDKKYAVCSHCHSAVMPNRGEGTMCSTCIHEDIMECQHNDLFF